MLSKLGRMCKLHQNQVCLSQTLFHWVLGKLSCLNSQWYIWACEQRTCSGNYLGKQINVLDFSCSALPFPIICICIAQSLGRTWRYAVSFSRDWRSCVGVSFFVWCASACNPCSCLIFGYILKFLRVLCGIFIWFNMFFFKSESEIKIWNHQIMDKLMRNGHVSFHRYIMHINSAVEWK